MAQAPQVLTPITMKEGVEQWISKQWELNRQKAKEEYEKQLDAHQRDPSRPMPEWADPPKPVPSEERDVKLYGGGGGLFPPIGKWDGKELGTLKKCEILRLSTNSLEKIGPGLSSLQHLRILSLGRNKIRKLENLSELPNLEELWLSYNFIEKLSGLEKLRNLKVLFMSNNNVKQLQEIDKLSANSQLSELLLVQNPIWSDIAAGGDGGTATPAGVTEWRLTLLARLPGLARIDGQPVELDERDEAERRRAGL
eukprot:TRINITY_DN2642_c1_g1_i1.p1 TRINITY_DN2642_c1_g1~~TRINITY_DN2642_c1_g1_i1.p1  ORF type:complete len:253 (+),score=110.92 TRINITY_DN2642_c1_g1_i1:61-819(+)